MILGHQNHSMVSSLQPCFLGPSPHIFSTFHHQNKFQSKICISNSNHSLISANHANISCSSSANKLHLQVLPKLCLPLALSSLLFWSNPAEAGLLSGLPGIESVPGPKLPSVDFLNRYNEDYQKKYADNDERIKSSPIIKELLERSKLNKEKNKQEIMDKYCLRGAEWGVGDCSTQGMSPDERDAFIAMLKKKAGVE
ncbi:hypothetical protein RND81_11G045700 [Saponaria officinalis]|uniref:Uncharacterized protein n=1 Tax=Saponaria officinalis TaxID=3572 RepID=A0AAW1HIA5_SAPOF